MHQRDHVIELLAGSGQKVGFDHVKEYLHEALEWYKVHDLTNLYVEAMQEVYDKIGTPECLIGSYNA